MMPLHKHNGFDGEKEKEEEKNEIIIRLPPHYGRYPDVNTLSKKGSNRMG